MKDPSFAKQAHQHARAFALSDLTAKLHKKLLDTHPANICRDWASEYLFKGALVFAVHKLIGHPGSKHHHTPDKSAAFTPKISAIKPSAFCSSARISRVTSSRLRSGLWR